MVQTFAKVKQFYVDHKFIVNSVILSLLFLINCFTFYGAFVAYSFLYFLAITQSTQDGISYIFISIPFLSLSHTVSLVLMAVCVAIVITKLSYQKFAVEKHSVSKKLLIIIGVFVLFSICHFSRLVQVNFYVRLVVILCVFLMIFLNVNYKEEFRLKYNLNLLAYSLLYAALLSLLRPVSAFLQETIVLFGFYGKLKRFSALFANTNILAIVCEIALSLLAYYISCGKGGKREILSFSILSVLGILTFSKAFLLLYALIILLMLIFNFKKISKRGWIIIGCLLALIAGGILIKFDVFMAYIKRFLNLDTVGKDADEIADMITTGRFELWIDYLKYIFSHPLILIFGRGLEPPLVSVNRPHNMYISMIYQMGITGFALFVICILYLAKLKVINPGSEVTKITSISEPTKKKFKKELLIPILTLALLCLEEDLLFAIM